MDIIFAEYKIQIKGNLEMNKFGLIGTAAAIALMASASYAGKKVDTNRSNNNKTVTTAVTSKKGVELNEWVHLAFESNAQGNAEVSETKEAEKSEGKKVDSEQDVITTNFEKAKITVRSNTDHDIYINFSCAVYGNQVVPLFKASENDIEGSPANVSAQASGVMGSIVLTLEEDHQTSAETMLIELDGKYGAPNGYTGSYNNQSEMTDSKDSLGSKMMTADSACDSNGNGVMRVRMDYNKVQTNTYMLSATIYGDKGAVDVDSGEVVANLGEAPAGYYVLDLDVGAQVATGEYSGYTASDYLSSNP